MELFQSHRTYKIFKVVVLPPFEQVRELSNGELVGKCYLHTEEHDHVNAMTLEEITEYIKNNHIEDEELY